MRELLTMVFRCLSSRDGDSSGISYPQNVYFLYLKFRESFLEIRYAAPLAINRVIRCDFGFCPKLLRNIRIEG